MVFSVDDLTVGEYFFTLQVFDAYGNWISDSVFVGVESLSPPSIDEPIVEPYEVGTTGNTICWNPSDTYPDSYVVYLNEIVYETGDWDGGSISINVDGLAAGEYTFLMVVYDQVGFSASSSVIQVVIDTTPPQLSIDGITVDDLVAGTIEITAITEDYSPIDRVEFYIDWQSVLIDYQSPYILGLDTSLLTDGEHTLSVSVFDNL